MGWIKFSQTLLRTEKERKGKERKETGEAWRCGDCWVPKTSGPSHWFVTLGDFETDSNIIDKEDDKVRGTRGE